MLTKAEMLYAISWKCHEEGVSYGRLVSISTPDELGIIYSAYEKLLAERKAAEERRLNKRRFSRKDVVNDLLES